MSSFRTALLILAVSTSVLRASSLQLQKGDHVVWIGNTFAERMQYFGEVEARLHARYPRHNLVIRNIAWPADTVSLRPRPKDFGDIHHYLSATKADVILAAFGFNETWDYDGEHGLAGFKTDLTSFLKDLQGRHHNGKTKPKIVLYSPIACSGQMIPDRANRNRLLRLYADGMKEIAASLGIPFVDLFSPDRPVPTINGVHLSAEGYAKLAPAILPDHLFAPLPANAPLKTIRTEVLEKNATWFDWYRTVNSFYIHGDRKNPYGVINYPKERQKLLQMTELRDRRIWKAARGESLPAQIDDSDTVSVPAKLPGSRGGTSPALSPAEERAKFEVTDGYHVELFASEQEFPELRNPVSLTFDARGRLWVATMPSYPHALPGVKPNDQLIILEDTDRDGKADRRTVFAENLYLPLGFELGYGGVYLSQEPNLVFLKDTDGDDRADQETILLHGFGSEDCHHAIHNFVWGPGGGLYMQESVFHHTQVETVHGPVRSRDNAVFRFDPRTLKLDVAARLPPGGNPWGHAISGWGDHLYVGRHFNGSLINQSAPGNVAMPPKRNGDNRYCGQEFISSRHWPERLQGKVFSNQYKNLQGVLLHDWTADGSTFRHQRLDIVFQAHNRAHIPVDLQLGPDGALYVADWYNPVLGHAQYSLRDERRDSKMGRIWRVTWKGRPLDTPANIADASPAELLNHLKAYEDRTRYRARRELWQLPDQTLKPALDKWITNLHPRDPNLAHHLTEGLWLHQQRDWINPDLFQRVSTNANHDARAAAAHLLRYWSTKLPTARAHFLRLAADPHPKVRAEALASATSADPAIAIEVLEITGDLPQDNYLKFTWNNAKKALAPALESHPMALPPEQLAKLPITDQVIKALIRRAKLPTTLRQKALTHRARQNQTTPTAALVHIIIDLHQRQEPSLEDWLTILNETKPANQDALKQLLNSSSPKLRQAAFAALIQFGQLTEIPTHPDALHSITRIKADARKEAYLTSAQKALTQSAAHRKAALFALGRIPGHDQLIFNTLAQHLPAHPAAAAEAILARPQKSWPAKETLQLLNQHLPTLTATPVEQRGEPSFIQATKLFTQIANVHKQAEALKQIQALQPVPIRIGTVPDQLRFDHTTIRVPANTPVELRLENPDAIQHNLIICAPGSLEKVGLAVDALLADPKAIQRDWIPDLPEVLHASPMAQAKQTVTLRFITPKEPGAYPYLCTVPGHWRIMKGVLLVGQTSAIQPQTKPTPPDRSKSNILILTGEPEYRTRTSLAELSQRLTKEHQLKITQIEVNRRTKPSHFPKLEEHLPNADLLILSLRFVNLAPDQYQDLNQHLTDKPFIAIRTTTHLFKFPEDSPLALENHAFPTRHFGTPYRGHHGHQSSQINYVMNANHPIMTGLEPRFWTPDHHYAVNPLAIACTPLMIGQGLKGRQPATFNRVSPNNHVHVLSGTDQARLIGSPHPLVWTIDNNPRRRALATTIGARKSFENPNVQRLYQNAILWCLNRPVPEPAEKKD